MIGLVVCYTCGKVLSPAIEKFQEAAQKGKNFQEILDSLGLKRYCCRTKVITSIDISYELPFVF